MSRPPFDILRWSFLLLAVLLAVQIIETMLGVLVCGYMVVAGRSMIGACVEAGVVTQIREVFSEALTAVMALLLASRTRPPD